MKQPIAVSGPKRGGTAAWMAIRRALRRSGSRAQRVTRPEVEGSALVLSGGSHVHPSLYGQDPSHPPRCYDRARDAFEIDLLQRHRAAGKRILAICRGMQLAVVAEGGTLIQDLAAVGGKRLRSTMFARREVRVDPKSRLAACLRTSSLKVNCLHSQGVAMVPEGMRACAWDDQGLVYAVESRNFIGVQWHPEYLPRHATHRRLFEWVAGVKSDAEVRSNVAQTPSTSVQSRR